MRFPWRRSERREAQPFTDAVVAALTAQAGGAGGTPAQIAALEAAAGLWSRAFASAEVSPQTAQTAGITARVLALVGRDMVRRGESVHLIDVAAGRVRLAPVGSWDVRGGPDERDWWYRADLFGPSGNTTRFVPGAQIVHARYAVDPARPWHGISPLGWARATGTLAGNLEARLGEEAGQEAGAILPVPDTGDSNELGTLRTALASLKGKLALAPTMSRGWGDQQAAPVGPDWKPRRLGADPPETLAVLRTAAAEGVLGACGIAPVLFDSKAPGGSLREAWREFLHGSIAPVGQIVAQELSEKLGVAIVLGFDRLFASDLSGRARAFQSMVGGGMDPARAAGLAGLMATED